MVNNNINNNSNVKMNSVILMTTIKTQNRMKRKGSTKMNAMEGKVKRSFCWVLPNKEGFVYRAFKNYNFSCTQNRFRFTSVQGGNREHLRADVRVTNNNMRLP